MFLSYTLIVWLWKWDWHSTSTYMLLVMSNSVKPNLITCFKIVKICFFWVLMDCLVFWVWIINTHMGIV
jgi:hypothetical protein